MKILVNSQRLSANTGSHPDYIIYSFGKWTISAVLHFSTITMQEEAEVSLYRQDMKYAEVDKHWTKKMSANQARALILQCFINHAARTQVLKELFPAWKP